jgi:hypothetical protein
MSIRLRPMVLVLALTIAIGAVPVGPAGTVSAAGGSRPYSLDIARPSDYVAQTNNVQCVGASVQMMLNIIRPGADRSARTQRRLQQVARSWSGPRPPGFGERRGASVRGWAAALGMHGAGPYRLEGADSLDEAMRIAARAIRRYRQPVGLLVWRGRHAWVMSGFEATADPNLTDDFRVTRAYILDPLYPHGSKEWGPSPAPGSSIPVDAVGRQFVHRRSDGPWANLGPRWLAGKWVLVVPAGSFEPGPRTRQATSAI